MSGDRTKRSKRGQPAVVIEAPSSTASITRYDAPFTPPRQVPYTIPVATLQGQPVGSDIPRPMRPAVVLSQAPYDAAVGKPRGLARLAIGTVLRAGLIGAACYAVGVRDTKQLVVGSLASSATLSLLLTGYHATRTQRSW